MDVSLDSESRKALSRLVKQTIRFSTDFTSDDMHDFVVVGLNIKKPPSNAQAPEIWQPIYPQSTGQLDFTITPGTINGLYASNISIVTTAPASTPTGYYYWAACTIDSTQGNIVTSWEYQFDTTPPSPLPSGWLATASPTSYNIPLGYLITDATMITSFVQQQTTSLQVAIVSTPLSCSVTQYKLGVTAV